MVDERSRGKPLQYILGDQPFGNLEILCRKGVLIPRYVYLSFVSSLSARYLISAHIRDDTEPYTTRTARWILTNVLTKSKEENVCLESADEILRGERPLRILDLCTGTGCISLLLHSLLAPYVCNMQIVGVDISTQALDLARENLAHNIAKGNLTPRASDDVHFVQADILKKSDSKSDSSSPDTGIHININIPDLDTALSEFSLAGTWDVIISNPPYISPESYNNGTTKRSVRLYEPKLALVPPPPLIHTSNENENENENPAHVRGDSFYPRLIDLAVKYRASLTVAECGDLRQALRVRDLMRQCGRAREDIDGKLYRTMATEWLFYEPEDDVHVPLPGLVKLCEKQEREVDYDAWKGAAAVVMTWEGKMSKLSGKCDQM